jgi:hypothetical protein
MSNRLNKDRSVAFEQAMRDGVRNLAPGDAPTSKQVNRMLDRWSQASQHQIVPPTNMPAPKGLGAMLPMFMSAFVFAATITLVVSFPMTQRMLFLHPDKLDGRADVELVLAPGNNPDDKTFLDFVAKTHCKVLKRADINGRYHLSIDLDGRSKTQQDLIQGMKNSGYLSTYAYLPER